MSPEELARLQAAARQGICGACRHARLVTTSRGSAFVRCTHVATPKYPPQPLLRCAAFAPTGADAEPA